jgi:DNA-directed RNA polymerase specialized sigma24 family protein
MQAYRSSPVIVSPSQSPHPLLIGTSLTSEDLAALKSIWQQHHPHEIGRLIGSLEWIDAERRRAWMAGRTFSAIKSLRRGYKSLEGLEVRQVSGKRDTLYGKELDVRFLNYVELTMALRDLPTQERDCWILGAYDEMTADEIATALDTTIEVVRTATSSAAKRLAHRIFERVVTISM